MDILSLCGRLIDELAGAATYPHRKVVQVSTTVADWLRRARSGLYHDLHWLWEEQQ